eukprot:scaffold128339_cov47-Attheya_sp.AAC.1
MLAFKRSVFANRMLAFFQLISIPAEVSIFSRALVELELPGLRVHIGRTSSPLIDRGVSPKTVPINSDGPLSRAVVIIFKKFRTRCRPLLSSSHCGAAYPPIPNIIKHKGTPELNHAVDSIWMAAVHSVHVSVLCSMDLIMSVPPRDDGICPVFGV